MVLGEIIKNAPGKGYPQSKTTVTTQCMVMCFRVYYRPVIETQLLVQVKGIDHTLDMHVYQIIIIPDLLYIPSDSIYLLVLHEVW